MSAERYSQAQVLCGLRQFWEEELALGLPVEPDRSFAEQLKAAGLWDDPEFLGKLPAGLQYYFGFSARPEEWADYLGLPAGNPVEWESAVAPRLTFRSLAEFVRGRAAAVALEPVPLLGKPCLTAGIFHALEKLVRQLHPAARRFGPSTPIRRRLRGFRLLRFWNRLRWVTGGRLPAPPRVAVPMRALRLGCLAKLGLGVSLAVLVGDWGELVTAAGLGLVLLLATAWAVGLANACWINPLPAGLETFGELARLLAVLRPAADAECL